MVPRLSGPMWKQPPRLIVLKIAILPPVAPKQKLESKSFRSMTPPKVGFLGPKKVLGGLKRF